jgi:hypothetical protein
VNEEAFKPTRYELAVVDALREVLKPTSPHRVIIRVFCRTHSRGVARVEDVPGYGAVLVLDLPLRANRRYDALVKARPKPPPLAPDMTEDEFWAFFQREATHVELLEHPDVLAEAVFFKGWCAGGSKHRVALPADLLEAVDAYRRSGTVRKLSV